MGIQGKIAEVVEMPHRAGSRRCRSGEFRACADQSRRWPRERRTSQDFPLPQGLAELYPTGASVFLRDKILHRNIVCASIILTIIISKQPKVRYLNVTIKSRLREQPVADYIDGEHASREKRHVHDA
jgi:hypothetical protein